LSSEHEEDSLDLIGPAESSHASGSALLFVGLCTCVIALMLVWPTVDLSLGGDHYVYLARQLARGSLNVDNLPAFYRDYVLWGGHKYLPFGPLPAVLLIPFISLLSAGVPLVLFGYALTAANVGIYYNLLKRIGVANETARWLVLLYFGGTVYLSVTLVGISTFFAQIVVTTFLLLAILETVGQSRPFRIGILVGLAASARLTAAFTFPFFLWMVAATSLGGLAQSDGTRDRSAVRNVLLLVTGLGVPLLLLAAYNIARFGSVTDTGFEHALLYSPVLDAARAHGLFSVVHVPKNLFMLLLQGPIPVGGDNAPLLAFPYFHPSPWGMGIFFTSPALVYLFLASFRDRLVQASWMAIALTLCPILTYYGIGVVQFGYRYALDFMPFVGILVARGLPARLTRSSRALIASSVAINIWGAVWLAIRI
jgi:hypothetical protein